MSQVNARMTYGDYLRIDDLLNLQLPVSDGSYGAVAGEIFFIVAHQASELWLKSMIGELDALDAALVANLPLGGAPMRHARRALAGAEMLVANVCALRSLDQDIFMSLRERLGTASGAQSVQFARLRELMGLGSSEGGPIERHLREWLQRRVTQPDIERRRPSLNGANHAASGHVAVAPTLSCPSPLDQSSSAPARAVHTVALGGVNGRNERYSHNEYHCLLVTLLDLSSAIWRWGLNHLDVTQRMIGNLRGTGGTSGVQYLAGRLMERPFPTLFEPVEAARSPAGSSEAYEAYEERSLDGTNCV